MRKFLSLLAAGVCLCAVSHAQDQQSASQDQQASSQQQAAPAPVSLGEIARQLKLKKQQKEAQLLQAKAKQITNDDTKTGGAAAEAQSLKQAHIVTSDPSSEPASVVPAVEHSASSPASDAEAGSEDRNGKAAKWKSEILALKNEIASMQKDTTELSNSIHYAGGNCIANCAQWNEKQQEKQQEVDSMKGQLEELQKRLEEMQESARKDGFGGSVYDPSE